MALVIPEFKPRKVAEARAGWWESHHKRDHLKVNALMAKESVELFGLNHKIALEVEEWQVLATKEHNLAEKEGISKNESRQHWNKVLELLTHYFEELFEAIPTKIEQE